MKPSQIKTILRAIRIATIRMDRCSRDGEHEKAEEHREKADEYIESLLWNFEERLVELGRAANWLEDLSNGELKDSEWPDIKEFIEWVKTEQEVTQ